MRGLRFLFLCASLGSAACGAGVTDDEVTPSGFAATANGTPPAEPSEPAASSSPDAGGPVAEPGAPVRSNLQTSGRVKATMY